MRKVISGLDQTAAERLFDFLFTEGIGCQLETSSEGKCDLWVRDEDKLELAKSHLTHFLADPSDPKFDVSQKAQAMRREQEKAVKEQLRLQKKLESTSGKVPGVGSGASMTVIVIILCISLSLLTSFGDVNRRRIEQTGEIPLSLQVYNSMTLLPVINRPDDSTPMSFILKGQVWRLITPIFLHASMMHLLFNCLFIYTFGRLIEFFYGPIFVLGLFLGGGILGVLAQAYGPSWMGASPDVIGASGGALALFSFAWLRPYREPMTPFRVSTFNVMFVLGFVFISMLPNAPVSNVANLAHLGGLVFGAIAAAGILDFLRR